MMSRIKTRGRSAEATADPAFIEAVSKLSKAYFNNLQMAKKRVSVEANAPTVLADGVRAIERHAPEAAAATATNYMRAARICV